MEPDEIEFWTDRVIAYPNVRPEEFRSFMFQRKGGNDLFPDLQSDVEIAIDGSVRLPKSIRAVPTYTVTLTEKDGTRHRLKNRVALVGYGSNASQPELAKKYETYAKGSEGFTIGMLTVSFNGLAVTHGAFLGIKSPMAATLHTHDETASTVMVGFYDQSQAEHMTGTEPNYEGWALRKPGVLANGREMTDLLAYVCIWGAVSADFIGGPKGQPVAVTSVPSQTPLIRKSTPDMLRAAMKHFGMTDHSDAAMRDFVRTNLTKEDIRQGRVRAIQEGFALAVNVDGDRVFPSTIGDKQWATDILARTQPMARMRPNP